MALLVAPREINVRNVLGKVKGFKPERINDPVSVVECDSKVETPLGKHTHILTDANNFRVDSPGFTLGWASADVVKVSIDDENFQFEVPKNLAGEALRKFILNTLTVEARKAQV